MFRESGEDLIGSAPTFSTYVLIECPLPWASNALDSKAIPSNLKETIQKIQRINRDIRFLLFLGESRSRHSTSYGKTRVIIFRKTAEELSSQYRKREFELESMDEVAALLEQHWTATELDIVCHESETQDIFVCTHGSHDKCCAKFGYPFYRRALTIAAQLQLNDIRVWQVSHIGGHRFAPTLVTFPDGRYYGALDETSFTAILQRSGNIRCLQHVYRGWGILPPQVQVMERAIAVEQGWDWFRYRVNYRILDPELMQVEVWGEKSEERSLLYTARIVEDKTQMVVSSCHSDQPVQIRKFVVENLQLVSDQQYSETKLLVLSQLQHPVTQS